METIINKMSKTVKIDNFASCNRLKIILKINRESYVILQYFNFRLIVIKEDRLNM